MRPMSFSAENINPTPRHPSSREELEKRLEESMASYRKEQSFIPRKPAVNKIYRDRWGYMRFRYTNKLVHRDIAETNLGRALESWEFVHHIDGNKCNNKPDNLLICSWEDHNAIHRTNVLFYGSWHKPAEEL
jgi:hypothetical protein